MNDSELDELFMSQAMNLARKARGFTAPNPLVGAVIVKNGSVIGEGLHQKYGEAHAEVNAINDAKKRGALLEGSTLYVNLEPCSHSNKQTPPCAPLLVQEKIKRVVIANKDPNPFVAGNGIKLLQENNIEVLVGIHSQEGEILNEIFFKNMREKLPFVHLKMAQSLDGKVALNNGESKYITGKESLEYVHYLRHCYDAVVVGKKTLLLDNPQLNIRLMTQMDLLRHPKRIAFIDLASIDLRLNLFNDENKQNTLVVTTTRDKEQNVAIVRELEKRQIEIIALDSDVFGRPQLNSFLKKMYDMNITSILVEGGPTLASQFVKEKLVDKISFIIAPVIIGEGKTTLNDIGVKVLSEKKEIGLPCYKNLGKDFLIEGYLCLPV